MDPLLKAALATLAALSLFGGLASLARRARERPLERLSLLVCHGVALGVALSVGLLAVLGCDGRPLLLCAAGPLLVLCLQDAVAARLALVSLPLVVVGIVGQGLALLAVVSDTLLGSAAAGAGAVACAAGAVTCVVQRRAHEVPRVRALFASQALALAMGAAAGLLGVLLPGGEGTAAWAVGLGVAGAVGTAARVVPTSPPGLRDVLSGMLVSSVVLVAGPFAVLSADGPWPWPAGAAAGAAAAVWAGAVSIAAFALVRAALADSLVGESRLWTVRGSDGEPGEATLPSSQALAAMPPLFDDALLRRPGRPRVIARVPARRLLDAALDKAKGAQPVTRGGRADALRVEVVQSDADVDVDGDPADLAEALCAVLDNALRVRAQHPEVRVQVHLRGSPAAVTFEIADVLPEGAEPGPGAGIPDADAPFLHPRPDVDRPGLGVALARARILVERNGGKLLTRSSAEGSTVQVTMPRRIQKGAVGQA